MNEEIILNVESYNPYVIGAVAYVEQLENGAKITIVDKNGTTTATVEDGKDGKSISSIVLNDNYTLTINYEDGSSTTTGSIRGATGASGVFYGEEEPIDPAINVWVDPADGDGSVLKIRDEDDQWATIESIVGEPAGFGTVTATVDANHGTPAVTVTTSGDDTAKNFAFAFSNLQPAPYDDSELQADFAVLQGQFDTAVAAVTTDTEVTDIRVGADGITDTTAGASVRRQFTDLKSASITSYNVDIRVDNYSQYFTDANNAPLNKIVYITNLITSAMVANLPKYGVAGTLITFSYSASAVNTKCQIFITADNTVYTRIKALGVWTDWKSYNSQDDKTLSADDVVSAIKSSMIQINKDGDFSYDGHTSINASGELVDGDLPIALSDYIPVSYGNSYWIQINSILGTNYGPRNLRIHAYNENKEWVKQLEVIALTITKDIEKFSVIPDTDSIKYLRVSVPTVITERSPVDNTVTKVSLLSNNEIFTTGISDYLRYGLHTNPPSEGAFNAIKRARQLTDAKWTPTANLPRTMLNSGDSYLDSHGDSYEGRFTAGQQYEGMPYSYTYNTPRYIGINEPIDLFYSCLTNPNSALYANSAYGGNTAAYYGITCSTVVGYALNLPNIDSNYYFSIKGMEFLYNLITNGTRHDISDMQIGDVLFQTTHVAMIGDIIRDGINITDIEVLEGTRQGCTDQTVVSSELGGVARRFWMTVDEFFTWFNGFALYRYSYIDSVKFNRNPFVPLLYGEKSMLTRYFPCMPFYGNRKVFKSDINGNAVKILIHDTHYTHLLVYKNGIQYDSYTITGLSSVDVNCEYGEAEYSANLVTYDGENNIDSISASCYWYTMPDYDFSITDDSENHNISVTVKKDNFKPWYVTFSPSASENNPDGFTMVNSSYEESTSGDETTYTFSVKKGSSDSNTCILAMQSSKYAYFKLQKTY